MMDHVGDSKESSAAAQPLQRLQVMADLGRWQDVIDHAAPLLAAGDSDAWVVHLRALRELKKFDAARRGAREALARWPQDMRLHLALSLAHMGLGLLHPAQAALRAALALSPQDFELNFHQARLLCLQRQYANALWALDQLLSSNPELAPLHVMRGGVLAALGRQADAVKSLDAGLRLQPQDASALALKSALCSVYSRKQASALILQALRLEPTDLGLQRRHRQLHRQFWFDLGLATAYLAALVMGAFEILGAWSAAGATIVFLAIGLRLRSLAHVPTLLGFCLATAVAAGVRLHAFGFFTTWQTLGWGAVAGGDVVAQVVLNVPLVTFLLFIAVVGCDLLLWQGWLSWTGGAADIWRAAKRRLLGDYLLDLVQRPHVRLNVLAFGLATVPGLPLFSPVTQGLVLIFLLPMGLCAASWLIKPKESRVPFSMAFAVIGYPSGMVSLLLMSWQEGNPWRHLVVTVGCAAYVLTTTHQVQKM